MSPKLRYSVVPLSEVPNDGLHLVSDYKVPVVLIVDDEPLVADSLAAILSRAGFKTMTAYDGKTALELATAIPPQLMISDVAMPEMNGVQLAISLMSIHPDCYVLLFSGHATHADLEIARSAGYHFRLLAKPIHPIDMLTHVSKSLRIPAPASLPASYSSLGFEEDLRVRA